MREFRYNVEMLFTFFAPEVSREVPSRNEVREVTCSSLLKLKPFLAAEFGENSVL